jgi:hypothetical protein
MKKGNKMSIPRTKEHNAKIGKGVSKTFTNKKRKVYSERMKELWKRNKN